MTNKKFFVTFAIGCVLFSSGSLPASAQLPKSATCPVMKDEPAKENFFVDYKGRRVYLCCSDCVKAFERRPEKYLKRLNNQQGSGESHSE